MNKQRISKHEVMKLLVEIEMELEMLENSLQSSLDELKNDFIKKHEYNLSKCDERITALENIYENNRHPRAALIS